jgi:hypothetical protein
LKGHRDAAKSGEPLPNEAYRGDRASGKSPVRSVSRGPDADLATALRLAAEAGEWAVVADLSRQLEALRRVRDGAGLRLVKKSDR